MGRIQLALKEIIADKKELGEITQKQLAERMGTSPSVVSALLKGDRRLHEDQIEQFCDVLGITLSDLDKAVSASPSEKVCEQHKEIYRKLERALHNNPESSRWIGVIDAFLTVLQPPTNPSAKEQKIHKRPGGGTWRYRTGTGD